MNTEEAKLILQTYRPQLDDASDPLFKEALLLVEDDSDLKNWLDSEQSFDQTLQSVEPPANLKDKILNNRPKSASRNEAETLINLSKIVWWRQPLNWSVAACFIALFTLGLVLLRQRETSTQMRPEMEALVQAVNEHPRTVATLDYQNNDVVALQEFLTTNNIPAPRNVPAKMQALKGIGCLSFDWPGHQMGLICFRGNRLYHLYVTERKKIPTLHNPKYQQFDNCASATWTSDDQIYILTTEGESQDLAKLL